MQPIKFDLANKVYTPEEFKRLNDDDQLTYANKSEEGKKGFFQRIFRKLDLNAEATRILNINTLFLNEKPETRIDFLTLLGTLKVNLKNHAESRNAPHLYDDIIKTIDTKMAEVQKLDLSSGSTDLTLTLNSIPVKVSHEFIVSNMDTLNKKLSTLTRAEDLTKWRTKIYEKICDNYLYSIDKGDVSLPQSLIFLLDYGLGVKESFEKEFKEDCKAESGRLKKIKDPLVLDKEIQKIGEDIVKEALLNSKDRDSVIRMNGALHDLEQTRHLLENRVKIKAREKLEPLDETLSKMVDSYKLTDSLSEVEKLVRREDFQVEVLGNPLVILSGDRITHVEKLIQAAIKEIKIRSENHADEYVMGLVAQISQLK
jgi:hypothetical protein